MRVLIVDDEVDLLFLYRTWLQNDGHDVSEAATGSDALEAAWAGSFELVLLDMMLPGLDGIGVMAGLARDPRTRDVPVVLISARVAVDDQMRGLGAGAVAYVTKPFSIDQLRPLITAIGNTDTVGHDRLRADAMARLGMSGVRNS